MCIRDRNKTLHSEQQQVFLAALRSARERVGLTQTEVALRLDACLLYTSDAADERSSVDLGGRRIIKKKKTEDIYRSGIPHTTE